jgi:hypothetical protein
MGKGKYARHSSGVKLPVVLIMVVVAVIAVIFAVTALVRSLHNEEPLPNINDKLPGQSQQQPTHAHQGTQDLQRLKTLR